MSIKPTIKNKIKKLACASGAGLSALALSLGVITLANNAQVTDNKNDTLVNEIVSIQNETLTLEDAYNNLQVARQIKIPTKSIIWTETDGAKNTYQQADEKDIIYASKQLSDAIQDYFKACGASDWVSDKSEKFWPDNIEYIITAIAFNESTYRTNCLNDGGKGGLVGLSKNMLLETLGSQWFKPHIWGSTVPQVSCNLEDVKVFNPTTSIEYGLYNIGYMLSNRFKQDKFFNDKDGERKTIWTTLEYSEELQIRLIIAGHRFGIDNVIDSIYNRNYDKEENRYISLEEYIYGSYVESVLAKTNELIDVYENDLSR